MYKIWSCVRFFNSHFYPDFIFLFAINKKTDESLEKMYNSYKKIHNKVGYKVTDT